MWCVTGEDRARVQSGPTTSRIATFPNCIQKVEIKKFCKFWPNYACDRWSEPSRQDDCNGGGGEIRNRPLPAAAGSSEDENLRTLPGPQFMCPIDLANLWRCVFFGVENCSAAHGVCPAHGVSAARHPSFEMPATDLVKKILRGSKCRVPGASPLHQRQATCFDLPLPRNIARGNESVVFIDLRSRFVKSE